jgi:hypothetical protein
MYSILRKGHKNFKKIPLVYVKRLHSNVKTSEIFFLIFEAFSENLDNFN